MKGLMGNSAAVAALASVVAFALDRIKALAHGHPEWKEKEPFASVVVSGGGIDFMRAWTEKTYASRRSRLLAALERRSGRYVTENRSGRARFVGLVHHTDAEREFAYDRKSTIGKLDAALDEALARGWTVVSMKDDWKTVFPR